MTLSGKWALVTGAGGGIGREIARGLASHGCHVVVHARALAQTEDLARELEEKNVRIVRVTADLTRTDEIDAMMIEAQRASGGLDIVYNNAAVNAHHERWMETPPEAFRACFEVNFIAPVRITLAALPSMLARKFGRVVQLTSGIQDQPDHLAYAASKAALDKFVRDTAIALRGTGVLMNLLDPGWIRTRLGGPSAPNDTASVLPGALVPALVDGEVHAVFFRAQDYAR